LVLLLLLFSGCFVLLRAGCCLLFSVVRWCVLFWGPSRPWGWFGVSLFWGPSRPLKYATMDLWGCMYANLQSQSFHPHPDELAPRYATSPATLNQDDIVHIERERRHLEKPHSPNGPMDRHV